MQLKKAMLKIFDQCELPIFASLCSFVSFLLPLLIIYIVFVFTRVTIVVSSLINNLD